MSSRKAATFDNGFRRPRKEIKKRSWSDEEEEVLMTSLKALVAAGWKSDNGFRGGYMNHLEDAMRNSFPETDITAKPHIESKLTAWKRTYGAIRDILNNSGVGFNLKGDHKIDCDKVLWEELTKGDSNMRNLKTKPWPLYEDWKVVFGKDRATGEGAHDFIDMVNDLMEDEVQPARARGATRSQPANVDGFNQPTAEAGDDSVGQSNYSPDSRGNPKKRKHFEESLSSLVDLVGDIHSSNTAKYDHFTSTFAPKKAEPPKSNKPEVWPLLRQIEGLTLNQMFEVGEKLYRMPECMDLFMGLEEDARAAYVERILNT